MFDVDVVLYSDNNRRIS